MLLQQKKKLFNLKYPLQLAVLALILLQVTGCATKAKLERLRPAEYSVGTARKLTLLKVAGCPDLRGVLTKEFRHKAVNSDWWRFQDVTSRETALIHDPESGLAVYGYSQEDGEVLVWLDAYDAKIEAEKNHKDRKKKNKKDPVEGYAKVKFNATVIGPDRSVIMDEAEYSGVAFGELDSRSKREDLIDEAAASSLADFFRKITPRRVREGVAIDKDAEDMLPVAELVSKGLYAAARERLESMGGLDSNRADIVYNLAVLADVRKDYAEALKLYDKAMTLGYKNYYAESRAACERRLRERDEFKE